MSITAPPLPSHCLIPSKTYRCVAASAEAIMISLHRCHPNTTAPIMLRYGQDKKGGIRESKNYGIREWHGSMLFANIII